MLEMMFWKIGKIPFVATIEVGVFAIAILPIGVVVEYHTCCFIVFAIDIYLIGDISRGIETTAAIFGYIIACKKWTTVFFS